MAASAGGVSATSSAPAPASSAQAPTSQAPAVPSDASSVRQGIFEAVDGAGVEPSIPGWRERQASEAKPKKAPKVKIEAPSVADPSLHADAQEASSEETIHPDVLKFFENELNPQSEEQADPELGDDGEQLSPKAQNRFQVLANRAKAAEAAAQQATEAHTQMRENVGRLTEGFQQMQIQNAQLTTALNMMMQRQQQPQQQQELDPATEFRNQIRDDALKQLSPQLKQELAKRDQEINNLKSFIQTRDAKHQSAKNQQKYLSDADSAARTIALTGIEAADMSPELLNDAKEMILATAWGHKTNMENAAKIVRQRMMRMSLSFIKAQSKANRAKMTDRQNAPAGLPGSNANARGNAEASWKDIKDSGAKNALDFMFEQDGHKL